MWNELETLVKAHVNASERHQRVLECISACRSKPAEEEDRKKRGRKREDKEDKADKNGKEDDKSWQDSERCVFHQGLMVFIFCADRVVGHYLLMFPLCGKCVEDCGECCVN